MTIGLLISDLHIGGGPYQLLKLAQALKKKNHIVYIYTAKDPSEKIDKKLLDNLIIKSCHLETNYKEKVYPQIIGLFFHYLYLFRSTISLLQLISRDDIDILNAHEWPMHWPAILVKLKKRIPVIWMCNDVWHVPGQEEMYEKRILFRLGHSLFIKHIDFFFTRKVDSITVLSNQAASIINTYYKRKAMVVRSGVDIERDKKIISKEKAREALGLKKGDFIFLCLQFFQKHRRYEDAVEAFASFEEETKNKNIKLYVLGSEEIDPQYAQKIKDLVKKKKNKNIIVKTGYLSDIDVRQYLSACDVYIFPNEKYLWGLIVVEAMAMGVTCLVSTSSGVHEIISDSQNGFLFKSRDTKMLTEKMKYLYKNKNSLSKIGTDARKFVFSNFSWKKYAETMEQVFKNAIQSQTLGVEK